MAGRNRFIRAWTTFMADYPLVLTPFPARAALPDLIR